MRGDYLPGDPVREQELADAFSVSRGPIREALRMLEKSGVITIVPLKGAHVTRLSVDELNRLFEIRCALVPLIPVYLLKGGLATVERLDQHVQRMLSLAGDDTEAGWGEYVKAVYDMNREICDASGNPQLANIWMAIVYQTARYTRLGLRAPARRAASSSGWNAFVWALKKGQADKASELLLGLIDASRQAAIKKMEAELAQT